MTDAPERIWLTTTNSGRVDEFTMWLDDQSHLPPEAPRTAYIRADLHDAQLAALRDRVEALQEALRVKPLEWDRHPDAEYDPQCNEHYGGGQSNLAGVNEYDIYPHPCATGYFVLDVMGNRCTEDFSSVEEAKAAAQADYDRRIRAALKADQ